MKPLVDRSMVAEARRRIAGRVRTTPTIETPVPTPSGHRSMTLKLELLQHTGSFKPRGAFNRVLGEQEIPGAGLIAASGGNHGLAVAYVARELGVPAEIYVTEVTPQVKRSGIAALGASVVIGGRLYQDALEAALVRAAESGALDVHAYDHPLTVAGQGTMAAELSAQVPDAPEIVMAVGGGGFIAGAVAWLGSATPVVAVEPEGSRCLGAALDAGHPVDVTVESVAADSLGARRIGDVPFSVLSSTLGAHVTVSDESIIAAQQWLWENLRLVTEPGGATALAAVMSGARPSPEGSVIVVCGSNTDPAAVTG